MQAYHANRCLPPVLRASPFFVGALQMGDSRLSPLSAVSETPFLSSGPAPGK